jgi:hypothetical protein
VTRPPIAAVAVVLALAPFASAGCHAGVTEVVVVFDSDIAVPTGADTVQAVVDFGSPSAPNELQSGFVGLLGFPVSVGVVSSGASSRFSLTIELDRGVNASTQPIVLRRNITDVGFVSGEMRMLVVQLSKACACQGTSCPNPGDPACDDIMNPATEPFDPGRLPPSNGMGEVIIFNGSNSFDGGGPVRPPFDAGPPPRPPIDAGVRDAFVTDLGPDLGPPDGRTDAVDIDGVPTDVRTTEGGTTEGGTTDGLPPDGLSDGVSDGVSDGGGPDGAAPEGGVPDGGAPEAGPFEAGAG